MLELPLFPSRPRVEHKGTRTFAMFVDERFDYFKTQHENRCVHYCHITFGVTTAAIS
jgi:hypothetical protein